MLVKATLGFLLAANLASFNGSLGFAGEDPVSKAEGLLRAGKKEEGKQLIARYLTTQESASAYEKVGTLYARLRDWPDSVHYFEIASHRDGHNAKIFYKLGLAQHQNKQIDDAVSSLRQSLVMSSTTQKTYLALGEILELSRDRYDARNIFLSALAKTGDAASIRSKLCRLNFEDNFFSETIKQCTRAVSMNGADRDSWALLARAYYLSQQRPEAFKVFQKALFAYPKNSLLYRVRGLIYYEEKAYEQAINDLGKAFGLDPTDDEAAINLARSYFQLGYYERALPLFIEACKVDRDYRFEFLSKQRELARKDRNDLADKYQEALDKF